MTLVKVLDGNSTSDSTSSTSDTTRMDISEVINSVYTNCPGVIDFGEPWTAFNGDVYLSCPYENFTWSNYPPDEDYGFANGRDDLDIYNLATCLDLCSSYHTCDAAAFIPLGPECILPGFAFTLDIVTEEIEFDADFIWGGPTGNGSVWFRALDGPDRLSGIIG